MRVLETSDSDILKLIGINKTEGIQCLFLKYFPIVSKTAYYLVKDAEAAKDLSQDLFLKLFRNPALLNGVTSIQAFLLTSIKNMSLNYIEANAVKQKHYDQYVELNFSETYEAPGHFDEERDTCLKKIVGYEVSKLPDRCRLIFSLSRFEGLSNEEISDYLGLSKLTIEKQITNALKTLRNALRNHAGFFSLNLAALSSVLYTMG